MGKVGSRQFGVWPFCSGLESGDRSVVEAEGNGNKLLGRGEEDGGTKSAEGKCIRENVQR
jgi:hypothetical protein